MLAGCRKYCCQVAARQFESALWVRPDHVPTYNNLAKAYFLTGLPELAIASYNAALRLAPSNAIARKGLAVITAAAGTPNGPGEEAGGKSTPPIPNVPPDAVAAGKDKPPALSGAEHAAAEAAEVDALQELVRDLPHVTVEQRSGRLTLTGAGGRSCRPSCPTCPPRRWLGLRSRLQSG